MSPDLDQLADDRLDDLVDEAVWEAAVTAHGDALTAAMRRAEARRAAIAGLPRPDFDQALRDRLILSAPRPRRRAVPIAQRWWLLAGAGLAAAVLVVVFRTGDTAASIPVEAPILATRATTTSEAGTPPAPMVATDPMLARQSARGATVHEGLAKASAPRLDDLTELRQTETARSSHAPGFAAPTAVPMEAPGPHELVLAWAGPERRERARLGAANTRELQAEADAAPAAPAQAAGNADLADAHAPEAEGGAASSQRLRLTLHNRTVTPWAVAAEDIRIEALDGDGTVVWRGRVLAEGEVVVAAGATATLFIDDPAWPAQTRSLRAAIVEVRSRALPLDAQ